MNFRKFSKILVVSLLLLVFSGSSIAQADHTLRSSTSMAENPSRTVSVKGVGKVTTEADTVTFELGVRTTEETAQDALDSNNEKVTSLFDALKKEGLDPSNLSTQSIQLYPQYDRDGDTQTLTSFTASNIIHVTMDNIDSLGEILDTAVKAGSNTINNIQFQATNNSELAAQARELAMKDARNKAEQLVELADASLGSVITIEELSNTPRTSTPNREELAQETTGVPIETGTLNIVVQVNVSWMIEVDDQTKSNASSPHVEISPASGPPGTEIELVANGLPANTEVELGLGRWRSEYDVISTIRTNGSGTINTTITIPDYAELSEQWVAVVATPKGKIKESSNIFLVTN